MRVRLSGIDDEDILSGFVLSSVGKFLKFALEVANKGLLVFDVLKIFQGVISYSHSYKALIHLG